MSFQMSGIPLPRSPFDFYSRGESSHSWHRKGKFSDEQKMEALYSLLEFNAIITKAGVCCRNPVFPGKVTARLCLLWIKLF